MYYVAILYTVTLYSFYTIYCNTKLFNVLIGFPAAAEARFADVFV